MKYNIIYPSGNIKSTSQLIPKLTLLLFLLLSCSFSFAGNYSWTGTTNTDWATGTNWSPNGVPSTNDTVTITSHTNNPLLAANTTVKKFTMTSGTLDCNSYTLTISATATFTSGTINNGTVTCSGTSTLTFSGTTFGAAVNATGNSILLNGSKFNSTFTAVKKGTGNDNGNGGNVFAGAVTITDSSSGNLVLSNNSSSPDTFNATLKVAARSSGSIYIAHQGTGNVFNGSVTMYSSSSGAILSNYYGTAYFNDSLIVNSTSSGGEYFGFSTGSCVLASGKTLTIGSEGFDYSVTSGPSGTLLLRNFSQGNATAINLTFTGSRATIKFESGCVFSGAVTISAPGIFLDGSRFLSKTNFTWAVTSGTGYTQTSAGGNYFGDTATIIQNNAATVNLSNTAVDTFVTYAVLQNTQTTFSVNNALFQGDVKFKNALNSLTDHYTVAGTGNVTIQGNATVENTASTIIFGSSGGTTVLDTNCRITIPSNAGVVKMSNVVQHGSDTTSITMTGTNDILYLKTGNVFNGPFIFSGLRVLLNGTTFNGTVNILRTSTVSDSCDGGNVFKSTTYICDSVNTSNSNRFFKMANTNPDDYNGNVTFKQYGAGSAGSSVRLYPVYNKNCTFAGNVTVDGNSAIEFGDGGGKVIIDGGGSHNISKSGSYVPTIKKLELQNTGSVFTLNLPLSVSDSVIFTTGYLATDTTNLLTIPDNCIVTGESDYSSVIGPVKKIGNDSFTFPLGGPWSGPPPIFAVTPYVYHPLSISAPSNTTDAYTAKYIHANHGLGTSSDSTIENVSTCEYWQLDRNNGSSTDTVKLGWGWNTCNMYGKDSMRVAYWNGSTWQDKGNGGTSGNTTTGTVKTTGAVSSFGKFALADKVCSTFSSYPTSSNVKCHGDSTGRLVEVVSGGTTPYSFTWWPMESSNDSLLNIPAGTYTVIISDHKGCSDSDTVSVTEPDVLIDSVSSTAETCYHSSKDGTVAVEVSGGTGSYTYLWKAFPNQTTANVTGLYSGQYEVTVTDSNNCRIQDATHVEYVSKIDLTATSTNPSPDTSSNGLAIVTAVGGSGPLTYSWNTSPTQANDTATGIPTGIYTATVTDSLGCSNSTNAVLYVSSCVSHMPLVIESGTPGLVGFVLTWTTPHLTCGDVTVTAGYELHITGTTAAFDPGTKLLIQSGGSLLVDGNSTLMNNCSEMWKGVELENGAQCYITTGTVMNAEYGINVLGTTGSTQYECLFGNFVQDYIGINYGGTTQVNPIGGIVGCNFRSPAASLISPYPGQTTSPGFKTYSGMLLRNNGSLTVGGGGPQNNFTGINHGIISYDFNLTVKNSYFQDIIDYDPSSDPQTDGTGILVIAPASVGVARLDQRGFGQSGPPSFSHCINGVFTKGAWASVIQNNMVNVNRGIRNWFSGLQTIRLIHSDNYIDCGTYGIDSRFNENCNINELEASNIHVDMSTNSFNSSPEGYGASYKEYGNQNSGILDHQNNIFLHNRKGTGVFGALAFGGVYTHFSIYHDNTAKQVGFNLFGCNSSSETCNQVNQYSNQTQQAYILSNSNSCLVRCNNASYGSNGFLFTGICGGTVFQQNGMGDQSSFSLEIGTVANSSSYIGLQTEMWDLWTYILLVPSINRSLPILVPLSLFNIDNHYWSMGPPYRPALYLPLPWFSHTTPEVHPPSCSSLSLCGPPPNAPIASMRIDTSDYTIAQDTLAVSAFFKATNWMSRKYLYEKLMDDTALIGGSSIFENFLSANDTTPVGYFYNIRKETAELNDMDSGTVSDLNSHSSLIVEYQDLISENNISLLADDLSPTAADSIYGVNDSLSQIISSYILADDSVISLFDSSKYARASELVDDNEAISASEIFETNQKQVNAVYLSTIMQGIYDFTAGQIDTLEDIAYQCPFAGGNAVYQARNLLSLVYEDLTFNDDSTCIADSANCLSPVASGSISGAAYGQCGVTGVRYSISSVSGATSYTWVVSDTNYATISGASNLDSVTINFADSLNSVVIYVVANNACGSSDPAHLIVYGMPQTPDTISGNISVCENAVEEYTASSTGATSYNWTLPSGATIVGTSDSSSVLVSFGSASGWIKVSASNGCGTSSEDSISVTVNRCRIASQSNPHDILQAYPNPSSDKIVLKFMSEIEADYIIYIKDISDRKLVTLEGKAVQGSNAKEISVDMLSKGIYFIELNTAASSKTIKITVE